MLYNSAVLSVLAASTSLISASVAAPLATRDNNAFCPAGTSYVDYESTSGFKGCTSTPSAYKDGPRTYWQSCPAGLGNWYVCSNGFSGCNTNVGVCDPKAAYPPVGPPAKVPVEPTKGSGTDCPAGQAYYNCATGFKGCSADSTVCDPKTTYPPVGPPAKVPVDCPAGETFYNCATGFKGCSADYTVCDPKTTPTPEQPPVGPVDPPTEVPTGNNKYCPASWSYVDYESTSGFKGCTPNPDAYKYAPRLYWQSCPTGLGNWYVCSNGFSGCNTNVSVCDPKY